MATLYRGWRIELLEECEGWRFAAYKLEPAPGALEAIQSNRAYWPTREAALEHARGTLDNPALARASKRPMGPTEPRVRVRMLRGPEGFVGHWKKGQKGTLPAKVAELLAAEGVLEVIEPTRPTRGTPKPPAAKRKGAERPKKGKRKTKKTDPGGAEIDTRPPVPKGF